MDILVMVETKIDDTFPTSQFHMQGYPAPFRRDLTSQRRGIFLHTREDIFCKTIKVELNTIFESFFIWISLKNKKVVTELLLHSASK